MNDADFFLKRWVQNLQMHPLIENKMANKNIEYKIIPWSWSSRLFPESGSSALGDIGSRERDPLKEWLLVPLKSGMVLELGVEELPFKLLVISPSLKAKVSSARDLQIKSQ